MLMLTNNINKIIFKKLICTYSIYGVYKVKHFCLYIHMYIYTNTKWVHELSQISAKNGFFSRILGMDSVRTFTQLRLLQYYHIFIY